MKKRQASGCLCLSDLDVVAVFLYRGAQLPNETSYNLGHRFLVIACQRPEERIFLMANPQMKLMTPGTIACRCSRREFTN
jgi:hypothetical protein